jgi:phosphatidate cytidylyltransferase
MPRHVVLRTRIATALVLLPLVLAALFVLPPGGWGVAALAVMLVAAHEWGRLAGFGPRAHLLFVLGVLGLGLALLYAPAAAFARGWPPAIVVAACGIGSLFWLALAPVWIVRQWPTTRRLPMLLVGWVVLIGAWVALVELQARSPWLVLAAMAIVWIADTAAYFSGRAFGRTKLAPLISPGKTWEGVYGALAAVAVYALLLAPFARDAGYASAIGVPQIAAWLGIVLLVAGVSIIGDLFESLQKRHAGVKDSGTLLPGHGGILDRIDALLAAMPLSALAAQLFLDRH